MKRFVQYHLVPIEYELVRKNVKNINLRIDRSGDIIVSASQRVSEKQIDKFILDKAEWIFQKMSDLEKMKAIMPDNEIYDGKNVYFLGNKLKLKVIDAIRCKVEKNEREIIIYSWNSNNMEKLKKEYLNWLRKQAYVVFEEILEDVMVMIKELGIKKPEIYVRNMKSRWGSCIVNEARIGLNVQLMKADRQAIEQVILHELIHFIYGGHDKKFYGMLSKFMPDWKERRERLEALYKDGI